MKTKKETHIQVHFIEDKEGKKYLEINDIIRLIEHIIAGIISGKLNVEDLIEQLKEMADSK
jgi:hypothetical protein